MGKLELYLLVGSGMWAAFVLSMAVYNINLDPTKTGGYLIGYNFMSLGLSVLIGLLPVTLAYWRFNKKKVKLNETRDAMKQR